MTNVRLCHRCVAVDGDPAEVFLTEKEIIADPEQVVFILPYKWNSRPHSSMNEEKIAAKV